MDSKEENHSKTINSHVLKVFYTNANDLKNKTNELSILANQLECKILCITETMFNTDILDSEISIPNFKVYRTDRTVGKGGGSCIYIHDTISAILINDFNVPDCIAMKLKCGVIDIVLIVVYRSPSLMYNDNISMIDRLSDTVDYFKKENEIIIVGDFNLPDVSWDNGIVKCPIETIDKKYVIQKMFLNLFYKHNLQWVLGDDVKTRRRVVLNTLQQATLDNILLTDKNILNSVHTCAPLAKSDHIGLVFGIKVKNNPDYISKEKKNWTRFSSDDIISHAKEISWEYSKSPVLLSVEDMWQELYTKLVSISDKAPTITTQITRGHEMDQ